MEEFRQHFLSESVKNLEALISDLQNADAFSDTEKRELFRALHTIKGSSQTFGFVSASHLTHELESILSAKSEEIFINKNFKNLFVEGIALLIKSLQETHFEIPLSFTEKMNAIGIDSAEK